MSLMDYIVFLDLEIDLCTATISQTVFLLLKRRLRNAQEVKEEHIKSPENDIPSYLLTPFNFGGF